MLELLTETILISSALALIIFLVQEAKIFSSQRIFVRQKLAERIVSRYGIKRWPYILLLEWTKCPFCLALVLSAIISLKFGFLTILLCPVITKILYNKAFR